MMPVYSSDGLPIHNSHICVDEVKRLEGKLKDPRSRLTQCWQVSRYPTCMEVNWTYTHQFYQLFTNVHRFPGFSGNGHACASSWYQGASLLPHGLGMRLYGWINELDKVSACPRPFPSVQNRVWPHKTKIMPRQNIVNLALLQKCMSVRCVHQPWYVQSLTIVLRQ